jgi:PhnB protein
LAPGLGLDPEMFRIRARRIVSWGIDSDMMSLKARSACSRGPAAAADTGVRQHKPRRCRVARSDEKAAHIPPGWHTVTPRIVVRDPAGLVAFVQAVFHAAGDFDPQRPTVLSIGDSRLMVSGADDRMCRGAFLYIYVPDVESVYRRALQHGAKPIEAPLTTPYGDRRCMVEDTWGNWWQIAKYGTT